MENNDLEFPIENIKSVKGDLLKESEFDYFDKETFNPVTTNDRNEILKILGLPNVNSAIQKNFNPTIIPSNEVAKKSSTDFAGSFLNEVKFQQWKLIANISSKLLSHDENCAILECLIDREEKLYEERSFPVILFKGYSMLRGNLFKICMYERDNQMMIDVKDNQNLILDSDFPKIDFYEEFKDLKLTNRS